jgi:hypothetical protein
VYEVATTISHDRELCANFITAMRQSNAPYYSYNFWRFFERALRPGLLALTGLPSIIRGEEEFDMGESSYDLDLEKMFLEDHWWSVINFPTQEELVGELCSRHNWLAVLRDNFKSEEGVDPSVIFATLGESVAVGQPIANALKYPMHHIKKEILKKP